MEKEVDIVALGELLIDFTEAGYGKDGMKLFEQNPGGAPANLLTVASHMGYRTSFIGKVGKDMHGAFLKRTLQNEGIAVDHLIEDDKYFTTLAFVEIDENGERKFSFARKPGADTQLRKEELDPTLLQKGKIFHFGSLSLTDEPAKSATLEAVHPSGKAIRNEKFYLFAKASDPVLLSEVVYPRPVFLQMKISAHRFHQFLQTQV